MAVLGPVGRNFAAGMSGGIAYLLDPDPVRVNTDMADLEDLDEADAAQLQALVERHYAETGSAVAARLLADWDAAVLAVRQGHAEGLQAGAARGARRPSVRGATSTRP